MGTRRRFLQPQHTSGDRVCWLHAARPPATHVAPAAPALLLHSLHKHLRSVCGGPGAALAAGATAASKAGQSPCPHGALLREDRPSPRKRTLCWESPSVAAARPGGSKGPSRRGFPRELTPERRPCLRDPGDPGYMKTRRLAGRWARTGVPSSQPRWTPPAPAHNAPSFPAHFFFGVCFFLAILLSSMTPGVSSILLPVTSP